MFVYNVTSQMPAYLEADWVEWMQHEHIPLLMTLKCFSKVALHKLIEVQGEAADEEMVTYTAQYHVPHMEDYRAYIGQHSVQMRNHAQEAFGQAVTSFRTVLQQVYSV